MSWGYKLTYTVYVPAESALANETLLAGVDALGEAMPDDCRMTCHIDPVEDEPMDQAGT